MYPDCLRDGEMITTVLLGAVMAWYTEQIAAVWVLPVCRAQFTKILAGLSVAMMFSSSNCHGSGLNCIDLQNSSGFLGIREVSGFSPPRSNCLRRLLIGSSGIITPQFAVMIFTY